ncbi:alpha/beta fold hydrolase [Streptomyces sp. ISL-96]|uniref:alpha/beta fold hydrolase n=1 Tax=Streptomyces sp. ISL-96 TaxID=2819191 RepID=UPI001BEA1B95|nr:alpha/beta hydrolase [Streptomyces sp. ISL-96]MBT2492925.1 alpha/beta fold hydrolase [Streptomyces sp. ISL-96]
MREFVYDGSDGCRLYATAVGSGPTLILLHGGGPDHRSLLPLAHLLAGSFTVVVPDVRGYGRSRCTDSACHTWAQYADDVDALLNHLGLRRAALGGTGLGGTITLRAAMAYPQRIRAAVVIGVEDIEDDEAKEAEAALLESFATRVIADGIDAAWEPILPSLAPVIGSLVRDAIPRSDPASVAAACAIGRDRAFRSVADLRSISVPTLIIPGTDVRHPTALAGEVALALPHGHLAQVAVSADLRTADDLAHTMAPAVRDFLTAHLTIHTDTTAAAQGAHGIGRPSKQAPRACPTSRVTAECADRSGRRGAR